MALVNSCNHDTNCLNWSVLLLTWRLRWAYLPFYCTEGDNASVIMPPHTTPPSGYASAGLVTAEAERSKGHSLGESSPRGH